MNVSLKTFMPALFAGTLSLTACDTVTDRAGRYLAETNHKQSELTAIKEAQAEDMKQSMLDSIAYRDIFNSTNAVKDSNKIAKFNKIAASMRANRPEADRHNIEIINKKLEVQGISVKEFKEIEDKDCLLDENLTRLNRRQHLADDWTYRKFFKRIGILNDSIAKKCDEVSAKICP